MADRFLTFTDASIRAMIAGRKTQTRRLLKLQPRQDLPFRGIYAPKLTAVFGHDYLDEDVTIPLRYMPGDRVWAREAWARVGDADDDIHACPDLRIHAYYRADCVQPELQKWRSPRFMPRWASRLTLVVTGVRVQRVQDISAADALAEGGPPSHPSIDRVSRESGYPDFSRSWFAQVWDSIHDPGAWARNEWVTAITFDVHRCNIDSMPKVES